MSWGDKPKQDWGQKPTRKKAKRRKQVHLDHDSESFIRAYEISPRLCNHLVENMNRMESEYSYDPDREYSRLTNKHIDSKLESVYGNVIKECIADYEKDYRFAAKGVPCGLQSPFNFQMYEPGSYYKHWHHEEYGPRPGKYFRKLVFMTYLNDIEEGGGTEFLYQDVEVEPKKGLTLIWPAGWTHPHRGIVAPNERKYIATGWYVYKQKF